MPIFSIIVFILILSFLIIIHEMGHLFAAKWAKIKIEEFGVGYPPRALKLFSWGKILFSLNWIPVGGFVKMVGEDGEEFEEQKKKDDAKEDEDGLAPFYRRSALQRIIVILAGVFVNFVFGIVAFAIVFSIQGIPTPLEGARIGYVAPGSPAEESGLQLDTEFVSIEVDGEMTAISEIDQVVEITKDHPGKTIKITTTGKCEQFGCQEMAQEFEVYLRTAEETPEGEGSMGIGFTDFVFAFYPWWQMPFRSMWFGLQQALMMSVMIVMALGQIFVELFQGSVPADVAGPVGIVDHAAQSGLFEQGWLAILNFAGIISINLAVMNMLPIPALDGGRALFIMLEKVIGKKWVNKFEGYANYGGMILLLGLLLLVTIRDVSRIFMR